MGALYLGCFAASWLVVRPFVSHEQPPAPAKAIDPDDANDLLFTPAQLPPGRWVLNVSESQPSDPARQRAREALGIATAADFDLTAIPVPSGVRLDAVRVDLDGRGCAVLTSRADAGAAQPAWEAAGWSVTAREFGQGLRVFRLTRNGTEVTAWAIPRGALVQLLITAPVRATLDGGLDR